MAQSINYLIEGGTLHVLSHEIQVEPVLVCDLKALVKLLGLYNVFHPRSIWKCPWCLVHRNLLGDFTDNCCCWPWRDPEEWDRVSSNLIIF